MPRRKSKNPSSCPRGKKLVKIGARKFCAKTGGKKKAAGARSRKAGSKKGVAGISTAARKKMMRATCKRISGAKRKTMAGLCKWANK
jgi:hypothetical protein